MLDLSLCSLSVSGVKNTFSPKSIAGCVLWLDAHDPATIAEETGVSTWSDKSGNNNHLVQATAENQPSYANNTITFDSTDILTATNAIKINGCTIFAVRKSNDSVSIEWGGETSGGAKTGYIAQNGDVINDIYLAFGTPDLYVNNVLQTPATRDDVHTLINDNNTKLVCVSNADTSTWTVFQLSGYGGTFNFVGDYNELIVYNRVLTAPQRTAVSNYLITKWGIS